MITALVVAGYLVLAVITGRLLVLVATRGRRDRLEWLTGDDRFAVFFGALAWPLTLVAAALYGLKAAFWWLLTAGLR